MTQKPDDAVVVIRDDGKEFLIKRSLVAEHVNRGFKVKDKKDQPTEEELRKAVGFNLKSVPSAAADAQAEAPAAATVPEEKPLNKLTVAELQEKAKGLGLPTDGKKADLIARIQAA